MSTSEERGARVKRIERLILFWLMIMYWLAISSISLILALLAHMVFDVPLPIAIGGGCLLGGVLGWNYDHVFAALTRTRKGLELRQGWKSLIDDYVHELP